MRAIRDTYDYATLFGLLERMGHGRTWGGERELAIVYIRMTTHLVGWYPHIIFARSEHMRIVSDWAVYHSEIREKRAAVGNYIRDEFYSKDDHVEGPKRVRRLGKPRRVGVVIQT